MNGVDVANDTTRKQAIHRIDLLIQRISVFLGSFKPPVSLVVTHKDRFSFERAHFKKLYDTAGKCGFNFKIIQVASFSADGVTPPGDGIVELITDITTVRSTSSVDFWPLRIKGTTGRNMMMSGQNMT